MCLRSALSRRAFDPSAASPELAQQWSNPSDVFSVLLILGGDVVARALAQLAGSRVTPVAFSFGWVAYAVAAVVSAMGDNALMPVADCACKVINGRNGFVRDNSSWVIGRVVRDFDAWMDDGKMDGPIRRRLDSVIQEQWRLSKTPEPPLRAGLLISVYRAKEARPGYPGYDHAYFAGFVTILLQFGLAAIPCGLFGDWTIIMVTVAGTLLAFVTGSLPQWTMEKWACRRNTTKTLVLTRGNGSQHAIVIIGDGKGVDLEDLAAAATLSHPSTLNRLATVALATLWILLLITAAGIQKNSWFLLAVGGIGILHNIYVAGASRTPAAFGIPLEPVEVIGNRKVMDSLFEVESRYPRVGRSLLPTFFPGDLRDDEKAKWDEFQMLARRSEESTPE